MEEETKVCAGCKEPFKKVPDIINIVTCCPYCGQSKKVVE